MKDAYNIMQENLKELLSMRRVTIDGWLGETHLIEPDKSYDVPEYGVNVAYLASDDDISSKIQTAMRNAFDLKRIELLKDGREYKFEDVLNPLKYDDVFEGFVFIRATTRTQPQPVDAQKKPINIISEPVWGARGRISVLFRCAQIEEKLRVYAVLQNIQILSNQNELSKLIDFSADEDFAGFSDEKFD